MKRVVFTLVVFGGIAVALVLWTAVTAYMWPTEDVHQVVFVPVDDGLRLHVIEGITRVNSGGLGSDRSTRLSVYDLGVGRRRARHVLAYLSSGRWAIEYLGASDAGMWWIDWRGVQLRDPATGELLLSEDEILDEETRGRLRHDLVPAERAVWDAESGRVGLQTTQAEMLWLDQDGVIEMEPITHVPGPASPASRDAREEVRLTHRGGGSYTIEHPRLRRLPDRLQVEQRLFRARLVGDTLTGRPLELDDRSYLIIHANNLESGAQALLSRLSGRGSVEWTTPLTKIAWEDANPAAACRIGDEAFLFLRAEGRVPDQVLTLDRNSGEIVQRMQLDYSFFRWAFAH